MSKTNHRVNKDREEKLGESKAHKKRRGFNKKASELIEAFELQGQDVVYAYLEDEEFEAVEKIRRRR